MTSTYQTKRIGITGLILIDPLYLQEPTCICSKCTIAQAQNAGLTLEDFDFKKTFQRLMSDTLSHLKTMCQQVIEFLFTN